MPTTPPFRLVGITLDDSTSSTLISTKSVNISPGITTFVANNASSVYNNFTSVENIDLQISFTTEDLSVIFDTIDIVNGSALSDNLSISAWFAEATPQGTAGVFYKATDAMRLQMTAGLGYVSSFSGSGNSPIEATVEFHGIFDGANYPLIVGTGAAETVQPCIDDVYVCGLIGDYAMNSLNYSAGVQLDKHFQAGLAYPTFVGFNSIQPTFTVSSPNPNIVDAVKNTTTDEMFSSLTNSTIYLRRCVRNGTRYAEDATEHAKIDIAEAIGHMTELSGGYGETSNFSLELIPTIPCDSGNSIFTVTTGIAISTV